MRCDDFDRSIIPLVGCRRAIVNVYQGICNCWRRCGLHPVSIAGGSIYSLMYENLAAHRCARNGFVPIVADREDPVARDYPR